MKTTINKNRKMNSKKIIIGFMLAMLPLFTFSQSAFDKFEDMDDVSTVVVSKKAFELMIKMSGNNAEAKEYVDMVGGLTGLRVFCNRKCFNCSRHEIKSNQLFKIF